MSRSEKGEKDVSEERGKERKTRCRSSRLEVELGGTHGKLLQREGSRVLSASGRHKAEWDIQRTERKGQFFEERRRSSSDEP